MIMKPIIIIAVASSDLPSPLFSLPLSPFPCSLLSCFYLDLFYLTISSSSSVSSTRPHRLLQIVIITSLPSAVAFMLFFFPIFDDQFDYLSSVGVRLFVHLHTPVLLFVLEVYFFFVSLFTIAILSSSSKSP